MTGYNAFTNYRFPKSLTVAAVSGRAAGPMLTARPVGAPMVITTASGLAYSRTTKTYTGTVTIRNNGTAPLTGPFQVLLINLTQDATLVNASGMFSESPFLSVTGIRSLPVGDSFTVPVRFKDPAMTAIHFSPATYTGGFN